jgi:hypothetical protein
MSQAQMRSSPRVALAKVPPPSPSSPLAVEELPRGQLGQWVHCGAIAHPIQTTSNQSTRALAHPYSGERARQCADWAC